MCVGHHLLGMDDDEHSIYFEINMHEIPPFEMRERFWILIPPFENQRLKSTDYKNLRCVSHDVYLSAPRSLNILSSRMLCINCDCFILTFIGICVCVVGNNSVCEFLFKTYFIHWN